MFFDPEMVVPDDRLSLAEGAVAPWADSSGQYYMQTLDSIAKHFKVKTSVPWRDLPKKVRDTILYGSGSDSVAMRYDDGIRQYQTTKPFEGVIPNLDRRWKETDSSWVREELSASSTRASARPATAPASSPRRWRSRSPASTSARRPSSRSARR